MSAASPYSRFGNLDRQMEASLFDEGPETAFTEDLLSAYLNVTKSPTPSVSPSRKLSSILKASDSDDAHLESGAKSPPFLGGLNFSPLRDKSPSKKSVGSPSKQTQQSYSINSHNDFGSIETLRADILWVNQTLSSYGFPARVNPLSSEPEAAVDIVRSFYALLTNIQKSARYRDDLEMKVVRCEAEERRLNGRIHDLKSELEKSQKDCDELNIKYRQVSSTLTENKKKWTAEKNEFTKKITDFLRRSTQASHEIKKRDTELSQIKERLHGIIADKTLGKNGKSGGTIDITNLLSRSEGQKRSGWKNAERADDHFQSMLLKNLQDKQKELVDENCNLRELLKSLQAELQSALEKSNNSDSTLVQNTPAHSRPHENIMDLPFDIVKDQIETRMRSKILKLEEAVKRMDNKKVSDDVIGEYRQIIAEQNDLLLYCLSLQNNEKPSDLSVSKVQSDRYELGEERRVFNEQVAALEVEKKRLANYSIEFNREKIELQQLLQQSKNSKSNTIEEDPRSETEYTKPATKINDSNLSKQSTIDENDTSDGESDEDGIGSNYSRGINFVFDQSKTFKKTVNFSDKDSDSDDSGIGVLNSSGIGVLDSKSARVFSGRNPTSLFPKASTTPAKTSSSPPTNSTTKSLPPRRTHPVVFRKNNEKSNSSSTIYKQDSSDDDDYGSLDPSAARIFSGRNPNSVFPKLLDAPTAAMMTNETKKISPSSASRSTVNIRGRHVDINIAPRKSWKSVVESESD